MYEFKWYGCMMPALESFRQNLEQIGFRETTRIMAHVKELNKHGAISEPRRQALIDQIEGLKRHYLK